MNKKNLQLKMLFIPMFAAGTLSERKTARLCGITPLSAWRLKERYLQYGDAVWIHGNTGRRPQNKRFDTARLAADYKKFEGTPFAAFRDNCADYLHYDKVPSYTTVYTALTNAGIISPLARIPVREKKKHLPRKERPREGELVQLDGCSHNWFMNGRKTCIHGAVDDATHKITALYMCVNECRLGYNEILRRTSERFGGFPEALYSDRSVCFFTTKDSLEKVSIQEQLAGIREKPTEWQKMAAELGIDLIVALSPEAKGRIERLWQTLQGRLPFIFRFLGIDTVDKANAFFPSFIEEFNRRFSVPAQLPDKSWQTAPPTLDLDFLMSVKTEKKTRADGTFIYHGYKFVLKAKRAACVRFILCLSERFGLRAFMNGKYYNVELDEPLCDVVSDKMPYVEKDLIYRYMYADTHSGAAVVSA